MKKSTSPSDKIKSLDLANAIISSSSDSIIVTDVKGEIIFWNKGAARLYKYTEEEILGKHITILYRKENKDAANNRIKRVLSGESVFNEEIEVIDKFKNNLNALISLNSIKDESGQITHIFELTKEISKKSKIEQKLYEAEALLGSAIHAMGEGFVVQDLNDKILSANQAAADVLGLSMNQLLGKDSFDPRWKACHDDGTPFKPEEHPSVIVRKIGKPVRNVVMNVSAGKNHRNWILINSMPVFNKKKEHTLTVTTFLDITNERVMNKLLKQSEQKYRNLTETAKVAISIYGPNLGKNDCLYVNSYWEEITGYTKKEAENMDALTMVAPEFREVVKERAKMRISGKKLSDNYEIRIITKSGEFKWIEFSATKVDFEGKVAIHTSGIDITDRKKIELELQRSTQLLEVSQRIAKVGGWELDIATGNLFWTAETYRILETSPSEFNPTVDDVVNLYLPEFRNIILNALELANNKGQGFDLELEMYTTKGNHIYVRTECVVSLKNGKPDKLTGTFQNITKQKQQEANIISAKENAEINRTYLDNIINNIGDPVFVKDEESRLLLVNDAFCKIFDLDRQNIIGKTLAEDVSPEERDSFLKIDKKVLKTGKESIVEEALTVRGGETKTISTRKTRYIDAYNKKHLIGVIRDITKQKIAEQKIKDSEAKINTILNSLPSSVCVIDEEGNILHVNDAWKQFGTTNGIKHQDYTKYNYFDVCRSDSENKETNIILEGLIGLIEGKIEKFEYEYPCHTPNKKHWFLISADLMKTSEKQIVISHRDVTSRKLAEQELKESLSKNTLAVDIAKLGVWTFDTNTNKLIWDDTLFEIFGTTSDEFDGTRESFEKYLHPEDLEYVNTELHKVFDKESISNINFRIQRPSGEIRYIEASAMPILEANELVNIVGINRDVTETVKAKKKLNDAFNEISDLKLKLEAENVYLKEELKLEGGFEDIIGASKALKKVLKQVEQVAKSDTTVLVLGETGTGKELIAKAVHSNSNRKNKPLIKVNCSALPAELIESELFGHEKGAFTGAINRKIGRFELAHNGTIFLDEIGDLPIDLQTRLLRVLQENEFERLGGETTIKVDVRVITATNRNLEELVVEGKFRQDLYYRLNVFPITSPPLRKRKEDIPSLIHYFINKHNNKTKNVIKLVHKNAIDKLVNYDWPGNIRELEHVIERAIVLNHGSQLRIGNWFVGDNTDMALQKEFITLEQSERDYIVKVLEETNGKIRGKNGAAEILGLKPTTLESRMKKLNISKNK